MSVLQLRQLYAVLEWVPLPILRTACKRADVDADWLIGRLTTGGPFSADPAPVVPVTSGDLTSDI